jgi:hypothetical protein
MTDTPPLPKLLRRTPEQRYAAALAQAARAKDDIRRLETRRKVIVGALAIRHARRSPANAAALIELIEEENTSDSDMSALSDLLGELHLVAHPAETVRAKPDQTTDGS